MSIGGFRGGNGQKRYLTTSSTQSGGFVLVAGRYAIQSVGDGLCLSGGPGGVATTNHVIIEMTVERALRLQFFGNADNATFSARIWVVKYEDNPGKSPAFCSIRFWGEVAVTCGSSTGATGATIVTTTEFIADTLGVWGYSTIATTPKGPNELINTANGGTLSGQVFSPANNTEAILTLPEFFDHDGVVIEFNRGTAASCNALYERTR